MKNGVYRRFVRRKASVIGSVILLIFFLIALVGPYLCPLSPTEINLYHKGEGPSREHLLGTDNMGRDTLTRLVYGARTSLLVAFISVTVGSMIGMILGVTAGYFGGLVDIIVSRAMDVLLAFPSMLLAIVIIAILGTGTINTMIAIMVFSIPNIARLVRSVVISIKYNDYIQICRAYGASHLRILATHIIPNSLGQIIVNVTVSLGTAILTSASLSFLGLGIQPPNPEWGSMLDAAKASLRTNPTEALVPGIAITLVVLSFSMVGDGLRDALDPKLKNC